MKNIKNKRKPHQELENNRGETEITEETQQREVVFNP